MAKKSEPTAFKKTAARTPKLQTAAKPRRLKRPNYQSLKFQKRIKHPIKLPNVWSLTKTAGIILWRRRGLFVGITLVYGLLNVVLAQGLSGGTDVAGLKEALYNGDFGALWSGLSIFAILVGSAGNSSNGSAAAYQLFLALIASLAIIWALRQAVGGSVIRIRDAYYRGMQPLIPFVLILLVIGLQLIPLVIGSTIYGTVVNSGTAVLLVEKLVWALLYAALALLSLYMLSSSLFTLYIVTLPDMTPMKALRSARGLVRHRRWTVLRKILCLPVILLVIAAVIMVPVIILLTPLAQWIFFLLTMFALTAVHTYMYTLYRELLND